MSYAWIIYILFNLLVLLKLIRMMLEMDGKKKLKVHTTHSIVNYIFKLVGFIGYEKITKILEIYMKLFIPIAAVLAIAERFVLPMYRDEYAGKNLINIFTDCFQKQGLMSAILRISEYFPIYGTLVIFFPSVVCTSIIWRNLLRNIVLEKKYVRLNAAKINYKNTQILKKTFDKRFKNKLDENKKEL